MKILSLYYTDKPGGFCKRLYRLLNALSEQGHEVTFLTLDPTALPSLSEDITVLKIPFPLSSRKGLPFWLLFTLWTPLYLTFKVSRLRTDKIVVFGSFYAAICIFVFRIPIVLFLRSLAFKINRINGVSQPVLFLADHLEKVGLFKAQKIVCMTKAMAKELQEFTATKDRKIEILPNDIAGVIDAGKASLREPITALTAGVIDERKNIQLLLDAFEELQEEHPDKFQLIVAGDGPRRSALRSPKNVKFVGWVSDMAPLYAKSDLVLHAAFHEGMPNVVLEALQAGLPVLVSDTLELREMVEYDELIFDPYDHKSLARKLKKLILHPDEFDTIKLLSTKRAEHFSFDWDAKACTIATS